MTVAPPRVAVLPGSFDPMTNGHLDLVDRAVQLFDRVVVGVLVNPAKTSLLPLEARVAASREAVREWPTVDVDAFDGLLVDFARRHDACAVVRGLRGGADYEYEWPMARMNREMLPRLETVFLAASPDWAHVSASLVRDIHRLGGAVDRFVPVAVLPYLPPAAPHTR